MSRPEEVLRERVLLRDGALYWSRTGEPIKGWFDKDGYHRFRIQVGRNKELHHFAVHRVMWFLHHGEWPKQQIDHINRDPRDNRIENLRDVSAKENNANRSNARHGFWISAHKRHQKRPWRASLGKRGLGHFATKAEARSAIVDEIEKLALAMIECPTRVGPSAVVAPSALGPSLTNHTPPELE